MKLLFSNLLSAMAALSIVSSADACPAQDATCFTKLGNNMCESKAGSIYYDSIYQSQMAITGVTEDTCAAFCFSNIPEEHRQNFLGFLHMIQKGELSCYCLFVAGQLYNPLGLNQRNGAALDIESTLTGESLGDFQCWKFDGTSSSSAPVPLTLADYEGTNIVPGTDKALDTTSVEAYNAALATACQIGQVTDGVFAEADVKAEGATVACDFAYDLMGGSTIVAELYAGACSSEVAGEAVALTVDAKVEGDGIKSTVQALLDMGTFDVVEGNNKNSGTVIKTFCARADVWDNTESTFSVMAYMMTVTTTTTFALDGTFDTTVSTSEFTADDAEAAATREIGVSSAFGACDSGASESAVAIGSVLDICVSIAAADTDAKIKWIKDVKITDAAIGGALLTTPISDAGDLNFVTTLAPNVNDDSTSVETEFASDVTISTLMIPKIYDELSDGSSSFKITGTAEFHYVRRLSSGERRLQTESAPFSLEVDLTKNDLPQVAMTKEESGAMSAGVGMIALAAGVAALF